MERLSASSLTDIIDAAADLNPGDSLSPRVLRAIARHAGERRISYTAETGAGGSTLLFSQLSDRHVVFAIEGDHNILTRLRSSFLLASSRTEFVEGPTQRTLPQYRFDRPLQAVFLDGPHGFPFPQMEYFYFYPHLATDGLLIVDDIHIRTIHELYRFLRADKMFELLEVVEKTAFFRRTNAPLFDAFGDGWWLQSYNRHPIWRYTWRERLRGVVPRQLRSLFHSSRVRYPIYIDSPRRDSAVGETALVRGRAEESPDGFLWLFARRSDSSGWWPQEGGPIAITAGEWEGPCRFGEPTDEGFSFEVASVMLDLRQHEKILRWFAESERSGRCEPMQLPVPLAGCGSGCIRVVRG
jgi:hypothetical protein